MEGFPGDGKQVSGESSVQNQNKSPAVAPERVIEEPESIFAFQLRLGNHKESSTG